MPTLGNFRIASVGNDVDIFNPSAAAENLSSRPHSMREGQVISPSLGHRFRRCAKAADCRAIKAPPSFCAMEMKALRAFAPFGPGMWETMSAISVTTLPNSLPRNLSVRLKPAEGLPQRRSGADNHQAFNP